MHTNHKIMRILAIMLIWLKIMEYYTISLDLS